VASLTANSARLRALEQVATCLEAFPVLAFLTDRQNRIVWVNRLFARTIGDPQRENLALEMTLRAGEKENEHLHHDETVYFVQGGKVKHHLPDGNAVEADLRDGHVIWHEAWTHTVENIGTSDVKAIIVESKGT
jgi:PAS domain-containing protein